NGLDIEDEDGRGHGSGSAAWRAHRGMAFGHHASSRTSAAGEEVQGIDRLAVAANLEAEACAGSARRANLGDLLAAGNVLAFLHEDLAVVRVDRQQVVRMLHDDEVPVAPRTGAAEDHLAGLR